MAESQSRASKQGSGWSKGPYIKPLGPSSTMLIGFDVIPGETRTEIVEKAMIESEERAKDERLLSEV